MVTLHLVGGARPNFIKVAPLYHAFHRCAWARPLLVHTGQHHGTEMSDVFFLDLGLPAPDHHLGIGGGSHAVQTGRIMVAYETLLQKRPPDWVIVVGDVDSTLACCLAARKLNLPVAHLEAGLRSRDRTMPEEINRLAVDAIADVLWTPSAEASENLRREGVDESRIALVGNVMMDSYEMLAPVIGERRARNRERLPEHYGLVTLHRPSNVDDPVRLGEAVARLTEIAHTVPLVFPVHPRTRNRLEAANLWMVLGSSPGIRLLEPQAYVSFMALLEGARLVITDSGGIQEEATYIGVPCLTLRDNTERPVTIECGGNRLVMLGTLVDAVKAVLDEPRHPPVRPPFWDGCTAERVVADLARRVGAGPS